MEDLSGATKRWPHSHNSVFSHISCNCLQRLCHHEYIRMPIVYVPSCLSWEVGQYHPTGGSMLSSEVLKKQLYSLLEDYEQNNNSHQHSQHVGCEGVHVEFSTLAKLIL